MVTCSKLRTTSAQGVLIEFTFLTSWSMKCQEKKKIYCEFNMESRISWTSKVSSQLSWCLCIYLVYKSSPNANASSSFFFFTFSLFVSLSRNKNHADRLLLLGRERRLDAREWNRQLSSNYTTLILPIRFKASPAQPPFFDLPPSPQHSQIIVVVAIDITCIYTPSARNVPSYRVKKETNKQRKKEE